MRLGYMACGTGAVVYEEVFAKCIESAGTSPRALTPVPHCLSVATVQRPSAKSRPG